MKKLFLLLIVITFISFLSACSAEGGFDDLGPDDQDQIILTSNGVPERKIIYTVNSTFDVNNLNQSVTTLKGLVENDEWFDYENISSTGASFKVRIKTERLDNFIEDLNVNFQVRSFNKQGRDVSLEYQNKTNRITSLNLQIARLHELYEDATFSNMLTINQQLSDLEVELMALEGELSVFDSLVDYSEVNITFYGSVVITRSPFFNRLGNGFVNGTKAVLVVLDGLFIVVANVIPFILVFGPVGYGIYYFRKRYVIKKKSKKEQGE
ncbi:DUF4349 domain-containing protein [Peloplasma aerotolerans]|uniref:DUF4349 domain-containing protein n=1 Tax=Peloplasma aerotolerans TaxID=3044389 RepID=A0AAW6UAA5_9MOLU|nr:DUF4349 domain-containing protein [Mariniplasma sp. M4Ah]MDI6453790.1 DUF4349 domain-containing protein [Mariniplasma sp. M4Ah]MDR4969172.1 DUF4349 domain-containing protein [Acholeplasmataceae bacterium]